MIAKYKEDMAQLSTSEQAVSLLSASAFDILKVSLKKTSAEANLSLKTYCSI